MLKHQFVSTYGSSRRRRLSPLALIGISVPLLLALIGAALVVILPRFSTHAANNAVNVNCTLVVPANPLSAQGLATPYQFVATNPAQGPCNEANTGQSTFVQAAIYDPAANTLSAYEPLVIDQGTQPAVAPVVPQLPKGSIVALWFGFNGTILHLTGGTAAGRCVNGLPGSDFGQFAYCNAPRFFFSVNAAIRAGKITVPPIGTASDGQPCPTTRSFAVVDMDQSDNVQTQYLANGNGQTAQLNAANMAQVQNAKTLGNPSDNALVSRVLDPALGCQSWQVPDLTNNGTMTATLATDELQAAANQKAPIALVPPADEMVLVNNKQNIVKVDAYRFGVDQMPTFSVAAANQTAYCRNIVNIGLPKLQLDMQNFLNHPSPDGGVTANSLFTFLANRMNATLGAGGLGCLALLKIQDPITLTTNGNGVVTAATLNTNGTVANGGTTTLTINGTAAQFTNGQAQVTVNKLPATATVNGTAVSITDGTNNAQNNNGQANNAQNNNAQNGQQQAAATATLTVNGTAVQFANGQAQVTINKLPATATLNGTAITITDGANNGGGNNGGTTTVPTLTVNGTATQFVNGQAQVTVNKLPATATLNGTAVSITDGANSAQNNNGQNANNGQQPVSTTATLTINGTSVQFTNGQAQVTINKLPAIATLNGAAITLTDGGNNGGGNNGGGNNGGGNNGGTNTTGAITFNINGKTVSVAPGQSGTATINNQTVTLMVSADGTMVTITNANNGGVNNTVNVPADGQTTVMVNNQPTTLTMNGATNTMTVTNTSATATPTTTGGNGN